MDSRTHKNTLYSSFRCLVYRHIFLLFIQNESTFLTSFVFPWRRDPQKGNLLTEKEFVHKVAKFFSSKSWIPKQKRENVKGKVAFYDKSPFRLTESLRNLETTA